MPTISLVVLYFLQTEELNAHEHNLAVIDCANLQLQTNQYLF